MSVPGERAAALELYRSGPGAQHAAVLNDNHARLKAAKHRARELGLALNSLKAQLDEARARQEACKAARQEAGNQAPEVSWAVQGHTPARHSMFI